MPIGYHFLQVQDRRRGRLEEGTMEVTPELLALLQELLDFCEKENARMQETRQAQEQLERIIRQVRCVLESMR